MKTEDRIDKLISKHVDEGIISSIKDKMANKTKVENAINTIVSIISSDTPKDFMEMLMSTNLAVYTEGTMKGDYAFRDTKNDKAYDPVQKNVKDYIDSYFQRTYGVKNFFDNTVIVSSDPKNFKNPVLFFPTNKFEMIYSKKLGDSKIQDVLGNKGTDEKMDKLDWDHTRYTSSEAIKFGGLIYVVVKDFMTVTPKYFDVLYKVLKEGPKKKNWLRKYLDDMDEFMLAQD